MNKGKKTGFLYLSEESMIKAGVLDGEQCVLAIEEMFKVLGEGDYLMGGASENEHGQRIYFPAEKRFPQMPVAGPDRRFMSMITYLGGKFNVCAAKWYGSNVENLSRGLPRSVLVVILNDVETGEPIAFMSANLLSAMRTGAIPAVGAKYLASKNADTVAVVGAGVISRASITCIKAALPQIKKAIIYDINKEKAIAFCTAMSAELGFDFEAANSMEEAVRKADVISIAASGKTPPSIKEEWLKPNVVIASQGKLDLPESLFLSSRIVFDEFKMHKAWKEEEDHYPNNPQVKRIGFPGPTVFKLLAEGKIKEEEIASLSDISIAKKAGRTQENERFIMIIGGMPVEDAAWGWAVYQNALKKGIGQELILWESPHWF